MSRIRRHLLPVLLLLPLSVAMLVSQWLPFVNGPHVWFGLPSMFVWMMVTSTLVTPALGVLEWRRSRAGKAEGEADRQGEGEGS